MLYLILAECGLELIPKDLGRHPAVKKNISRLGDIGKILDVSIHHSAMKQLKDSRSRGRPDIVHKFLIDSLSSILNKWNQLRIYIHTNEDKLYEVNPYMRPPKDMTRFKGLAFKLLQEDVIKIDNELKIANDVFIIKDDFKNLKIPQTLGSYFSSPVDSLNKKMGKQEENNTFGPPDDFLSLDHFVENGEIVLLRRVKKNISKFIDYLKPNKTLLFTTKGSLKKPDQIFLDCDKKDHIIAIVGGFQAGGFSERISKLKGESVSIFPIGLESWTVINRILVYYELHLMK